MAKQLTPKIRFSVFKRDKHTCQYCGKKAPEVVLHAEHKIAKINGGTNDLNNLVTSCATCNYGKYAEDYKEKHSEEKTLIKRTYRITETDDKLVKKNAKKLKVSESGYIRLLIEEGILLKVS